MTHETTRGTTSMTDWLVGVVLIIFALICVVALVYAAWLVSLV